MTAPRHATPRRGERFLARLIIAVWVGFAGFVAGFLTCALAAGVNS